MGHSPRALAELYLLRLIVARADLARPPPGASLQEKRRRRWAAENEQWCSGTLQAFREAGALSDAEAFEWRERFERILTAAAGAGPAEADTPPSVMARAEARLQRLTDAARTTRTSSDDARRLELAASVYGALGLLPSPHPRPGDRPVTGSVGAFDATRLTSLAVPISLPPGAVMVSHAELYETGLALHGRIEPRSAVGASITMGPEPAVSLRDASGTAYRSLGEVSGEALGTFIAWFVPGPPRPSEGLEVVVRSAATDPLTTSQTVIPFRLVPDRDD
jgi:hypothetical protein